MPEYIYGFKELADQLGHPVVGDPLTEVEYLGDGNFAQQWTSTGHFFWVKSINKCYFFPAHTLTPPPTPPLLAWPMQGTLIVTNRFGTSPNEPPYGPEGHRGIDIIPDASAPSVDYAIYAAADGHALAMESADFGHYTKIVSLDVRYSYYYCHLASPGVNGSREKGQFVGYMGSTGAAQGAHLHFAVFDHTIGKFIDPLPLLEEKHDLSFW